jgi:hypothetical protein
MPSDAVIAEQRSRWLSMKHVGKARPRVRAFVRKGHLTRHYKRLADDQVFGYIPGLKSPNDVWYGQWVADSDYVEIPTVKDAKGDQDYSQNGIEQVTMTIDNIGMIEKTGNLGALFHMIERGYYSPQRGNRSSRGETAGEKNAWFDVWKDKSTQIMILCGYGEAVFPLHCGLIDKVNLTSRPDQIVVNMRSMGQFVTDQNIFGDAKNLWLRDPITFADRVSVQEGPNVANQANAKSSKPGSNPSFAVDGSGKSAWVSEGHDDPREIEWIEFPVPSGRFIKFEMYPAFTNMEMFVSIFTTNTNVPGDGKARFANGKELGEGWVSTGEGQVPGTTIPFVNHVPGVRESMTTYPITSAGQKIISGDNTRIRLWFRGLQSSPRNNGKGSTNRAGVRECRIRDVAVPDAAKRGHWILIDDVSDMVKMVLQWAGIHDWEIEKTGVRLSDKVVFDRSKKLVDIINYIKEQVSFVFYMRPPDDFDLTDLSAGNSKNLSMGVAVFRQSSAMKDNPPEAVESVRDSNLLTAVNAEFDSGQLPDSIRVRGKAVSDKIAINDPGHIHPLGADRTKRFQASYRPVWARRSSQGQAHLRKPIVKYEPLIDELYLCEVTCLLIAFQAALASAKGQIEIPLWPLIHLDHQTLLYDEGTGMSTRIWNVQRSWNYVGGAETEFKMNLGGSFIDVNDVAETREELVELLSERGRMPAPIARGPWTKPHTF